ncbi:MAG: PP2C family protein-serine/threonine phosphatase [Candidatus Theseobacter exili]|nr:PP2C family protein-serine/threonine phosphatase [Candidatus Theseobacter exili]
MNIYEITTVPGPYRNMFISEQIKWVKRSVSIQCLLIIAVYIIFTPLNFVLDPDEFRIAEIPWGLLLIAGTLLVFYFNRITKTLFTTKASAFLFIILLLIVVTKTSLLYKEYGPFIFSIYVLTLFMVSLVIPWSPSEALVIAALHFIAYDIFYIFMTHAVVLTLNIKQFMDGLMLLFFSTIICIVVRSKETRRNIEKFILQKEVESQNEQMKSELKLALRIQKTLNPVPLYSRYVDVYAHFLPASFLGGDYAQFVFLNRNQLLFIISDVTGHGVASALLVNRFHAEFQILSQNATDPGLLMNHLNAFIKRDFAGTYMYLSSFCGILDFSSGILRYSNYGHPSQFLYCSAEEKVIELESHTSFLGLPFHDGHLYQSEQTIQAGDRLLLFTDGVIEIRDLFGQEYGYERLKGFLKQNHAMNVKEFDQELLEHLRAYKSGPFMDDIFLVDFKIKEIEKS